MSASDKSKPEPKNGGDSDYDSAEDDDFNGDDDFSNSSSDESNAPNRSKRKDKNLDSGDEATIETRKKRRKDDDGDLILTRAQRRAKAEEQETKAAAKLVPREDEPEKLDEVWKKLNAEPNITTSVAGTESIVTGDTVKIKRTYEFAGQVVTEEKEVARESAEAKAYLSSLHNPMTSTQAQQNAKPASRRPVKRTSKLEAMAQSGKPAKLNVLEKSRLDWAGFVDKEGIHDDLKRYNKDGYVERQEFLKRTR